MLEIVCFNDDFDVNYAKYISDKIKIFTDKCIEENLIQTSARLSSKLNQEEKNSIVYYSYLTRIIPNKYNVIKYSLFDPYKWMIKTINSSFNIKDKEDMIKNFGENPNQLLQMMLIEEKGGRCCFIFNYTFPEIEDDKIKYTYFRIIQQYMFDLVDKHKLGAVLILNNSDSIDDFRYSNVKPIYYHCFGEWSVRWKEHYHNSKTNVRIMSHEMGYIDDGINDNGHDFARFQIR